MNRFAQLVILMAFIASSTFASEIAPTTQGKDSELFNVTLGVAFTSHEMQELVNYLKGQLVDSKKETIHIRLNQNFSREEAQKLTDQLTAQLKK